jgi:hypothetical protein
MRPTLPPALNIIGGPAVNYYNQWNFQRNQTAIDQRLLNAPGVNLNQQFAPDPDDLIPRLPQTGHISGFQYYTPYFGPANMQRSYFPYNPSTGGYYGGGTAAAVRPGGGMGTGTPGGPGNVGPLKR